MKDLLLGQEPAFPCEVSFEDGQLMQAHQNGNTIALDNGMSKRFYAACMAMAAIISKETQFGNNIGLPDIAMTIREAYSYADELLERELR